MDVLFSFFYGAGIFFLLFVGFLAVYLVTARKHNPPEKKN